MVSGGASTLAIDRVTLLDALGCLRVMVVFAGLLLVPGWCLGQAINLLEFRQRAFREQLLWSVALSFAVMPIVAVAILKYASMSVMIWLVSGCTVCVLGTLVWDAVRRTGLRAGSRQTSRASAMWVGFITAWVLFVLAELLDVGIGNRLYLSVTVYDHALRTAFVDAVMRTGVPPVNPLYWPISAAGHGAPMRYYYFWYVLTAVAARLGGATARQATIASAAWAGFGLAATLGLYCRHFLPQRSKAQVSTRWSREGLALALLAVTGLDILPAAVKGLLRMPADADMEWWSQAQVTSWMDSLLWVPHHIAGLVCCLTGFLLVWMAKGVGRKDRAVCAGLAGVGFASAFGLSTWVAVAFAIVIVGWAVWVIAWWRSEEDWKRGRVPVLLTAAIVAAIVLLPYLTELHGESSGVITAASGSAVTDKGGATSAANATHLLQFGVRHIIDPDALLVVPGFAQLKQIHPQFEDALAGLVLLLPGYITELGFYGLLLLVAVRAARRGLLDEAERTALVLTITGLLVATFLGSAVVANNDFGMRSILIAQFFLLLLAVRWFEGGLGNVHSGNSGQPAMRRIRFAMMATLSIGIAGTMYQAVMLRLYLPVQQRFGNPELAGLAERAMAWRKGFDAMDSRLPKDAVIQFNTAQPNDFFGYAQMLHVRRQIASGLPVCAAAFGGDPGQCGRIGNGVAALFAAGEGDIYRSDEQAVARCSELAVDDLVATKWDKVWADRASWVWSLPVMVDTGEMRVLDCRGSNASR